MPGELGLRYVQEYILFIHISIYHSPTHDIHQTAGCLDAMQHLRRSEACEGEHANLVDHMVPAARRAGCLEAVKQLLTHADDAVCHALQLNLHSEIV